VARKPAREKEESVRYPVDLPRIESAIMVIRGERVILDSDLAGLYGTETKRLNEQVKRNALRFGEKYAFQLTKKEFEALRSQIATSKDGSRSQDATSKTGRGGRRYPPWVFTEHGVVMAATVLNSGRAIEASKFIVDVFVELKRRLEKGQTALPGPTEQEDPQASPIQRLSGFSEGVGLRLQAALDHVLNSIVDPERGTTVREETQTLIKETVQNLKDRLKRQGLENEEIKARVTRLLAEVEKDRALTAKTEAETEAITLATNARKLRLLLEADRVVEHGSLDSFLVVLKEISGN